MPKVLVKVKDIWNMLKVDHVTKSRDLTFLVVLSFVAVIQTKLHLVIPTLIIIPTNNHQNPSIIISKW